MTRRGNYVGKGCLRGGLFVLPVILNIPPNIAYFIPNRNNINYNNASSFTYIVGSVNVWHDKLRHVGIKSLKLKRNCSDKQRLIRN